MGELAPAHRHCMLQQEPPAGPLPSTLVLQQLQFSNKLEVAVTACSLSFRRCVLQQDTANAPQGAAALNTSSGGFPTSWGSQPGPRHAGAACSSGTPQVRPTGPLPSTLLLQQVHLSNKL